LIVIRTKKARFAPQVWSVIACAVFAIALPRGSAVAQNKVGPQIESAKRTSNGLVIKSSGSVRTPEIKAPSRFKVPTAAQYQAIQQKEAGRAQKPDPRIEQNRRKNLNVVGSTGKSGARNVKK
jgi:hypothetical protein